MLEVGDGGVAVDDLVAAAARDLNARDGGYVQQQDARASPVERRLNSCTVCNNTSATDMLGTTPVTRGQV